MTKKLWTLVSVLLIATMVLAACKQTPTATQPAVQPTNTTAAVKPTSRIVAMSFCEPRSW